MYYYIGALVVAIYFVTIFIFSVLLRGFAPFISSRPWVIKQILDEIELKPNSIIYSFGSGKSGFLYAIGKKYPDATLIGVEWLILPFISSKIQVFLRRAKIKVLFKRNLREVDIKKADLIYCYLDVDILKDLAKKFKFECRPGTKIVSNGFVVPGLEPTKVLELTEKKGRFAFLLKNRRLWLPKRKRSKKENKIYFYEI